MFNTILHFAICVYQHKLGPCIVNKLCTVNALLGCPHLDFVMFMPDMFFCKESSVNKQFKL